MSDRGREMGKQGKRPWPWCHVTVLVLSLLAASAVEAEISGWWRLLK
jgi:hypothetical protein